VADRGVDRRLAAAVLLLSVAVAGCTLSPGAVDGPIAVPLRVTTTPSTIEVDAPGWFADVSAIYLCPTEPPPLPEAAADRVGWSPDATCHDFGRFPSADGLAVELPLADLSGPSGTALAASEQWYLLLLDLDGDRVSSAIRSAFAPPVRATAS
jgi:hypothetical protein